MRVLVACEFSGIVRDAFRSLGHDAWSCDLLPTESTSARHIQGDALFIIKNGFWDNGQLCKIPWDLIIAHPPCTRLCNSGVRWLHERNLWEEMEQAALFFRSFLELDCPRVAVENPVMHRYAREIVGRGPDFTTQPWEHGEPHTKRTCFWTNGLPALKPTNIVTERRPSCHYASPGPQRWRERSRTYPGIAMAMAQQWGGSHD